MSIQRWYSHIKKILTLKIIKIQKRIFITFDRNFTLNLKQTVDKTLWVQRFCLFHACVSHLCPCALRLTHSLGLQILHFLQFPVASIYCRNDGKMTHMLTAPPLPLFSVTPHPPQPLTAAWYQNGGGGDANSGIGLSGFSKLQVIGKLI